MINSLSELKIGQVYVGEFDEYTFVGLHTEKAIFFWSYRSKELCLGLYSLDQIKNWSLKEDKQQIDFVLMSSNDSLRSVLRSHEQVLIKLTQAVNCLIKENK